MKEKKFLLLIFLLSVSICVTFGIKKFVLQQSDAAIKIQKPDAVIPVIPPPKNPETPKLAVIIPPYLEYGDIVNQLKQWQEEAPDLIYFNTYGKSRQGKEIAYICLTNKLNKQEKETVLLTAAIHGNEPWSTGCMMAYAGMLASEYGKNPVVTELLDSRKVYIVPVVSPDSYPNSRTVDGVDPNRDFPGPHNPDHISSPSVVAIQDFFLKISPKAVISGHTFGRVFLTPYGDTTKKTPNEAEYQEIIGQMSKMSKYRLDRICNNYGKPIFGTEVDWYYRNGAFSLVMECGSHQIKPSHEQIKEEFGRTWEAVLHFIKYAPLVELKSGEDFDFSSNTGIAGRFLPLLKDEYVPLSQ